MTGTPKDPKPSWREQRGRRYDDGDSQEMYQVDVVIALFGILLLLLLTVVPTLRNESDDASKYTYKPRDTLSKRFILASVIAPYRESSHWVIAGDKVLEIDFGAIAKRYVRGAKGTKSWTDYETEGVYLTIKRPQSGSGGPFVGSYSLELDFHSGTVPAALVRRAVELDKKGAIARLAKVVRQPVTIHVLRDPKGYAARIKRRFRLNHAPLRIVQTFKLDTILLEHKASRFSLQDAIKAY